MVRPYSHDGRGGSTAGVELLLHSKEHTFHNIMGLTIIRLVFQSLLDVNTIPALLQLVPGGLAGLLYIYRERWLRT